MRSQNATQLAMTTRSELAGPLVRPKACRNLGGRCSCGLCYCFAEAGLENRILGLVRWMVDQATDIWPGDPMWEFAMMAFYQWRLTEIRRIVREVGHFYILNRRADCPLCGLGSSSPYVQGWDYPVGLEKHLMGGHPYHKCREMHELENTWRREHGLRSLEYIPNPV